MPISHISPNFSHVYPHSHALLTVHPLSVFDRTLVTVCATVYSWVWGHSLDCGWPTRIHTSEKPGSLSQGSHQLFTAPWRGLGLRSPFMLEFWRFNLTLDVCRQPQFMSIMTPSLPKDAISSRSSHTPGSHHHSTPFSPMVPEACGGKCDTEIPFVDDHLLILRALTSCEFLD